MAESRAKTVGTIRKPSTQKISKRDALRLVSDAIQEDYGKLAGRHSHIAKDAGAASDKTAEAWTGEVSLPGLHYFLNLGMRSPAIQKMVMRLWNLDPDIDPAYQPLWNELMRVVQGGGGS